MVTRPSDRKRPLGQPVQWKVHKQLVTATKAVQAGYQLKRSANPPLVPVEMEPGETVQFTLDLVHPFTLDPALELDLQEALALAAKKPQWLLGRREALRIPS